MIPTSNHYWLTNAHVPAALLVRSKQGKSRNWLPAFSTPDDLYQVDIEIIDGFVASIATTGTLPVYQAPSIDLRGGMVFPCFVDLHTHLDKGHTWERSPNPDGTFAGALTSAHADKSTLKNADRCWDAEDVYRRMEFGLKCSYAHGTQAIRTHIDASGEQAAISLEVFKALQAKWADRLILQVAALVSLDYYLTPEGEKLADRVAEAGGILGGVAFMQPGVESHIDRAFVLAKERKLNLDFHVDETDNPDSITLRYIAEATIRHHYQGKVVCGHACSLAVQEAEAVAATIARIKQAKIGIVSLPLCNLYLQGRQPGCTPRWRGVTLLHELRQQGISVAIASDNCRDPFHGFGDHDALEVFSLSVKIAHLDRPYDDWCRSITTTPADLMGLPTVGRIGVGLPADLVLFRGRRYSELLSRSQRDRIVLRGGKKIDTTLPDYAELDDLQHRRVRTEE
ncbi:cytosine deaminase [Kovacikia minuta CCNUW1]|uniref:cytosine deaminase n=1 Tax=Kovacikia minuta TaxID=2931930 RepID=UPI001CCDBBFB|nr:cytosine deaminase [Kovacikia minuta]UBF28568.1 cytosine deaminase [Kovacikia minuta CCNUW1]